MAEDTVNDAIAVGGLDEHPCMTEELKLHGWMSRNDPAFPEADHLRVYGADLLPLQALVDEDPARSELLHPRLPYTVGQVVWASRHEMARTVEDVLARRTRSLLLDARASIEAAPRVAALLAEELGRDTDWVAAQVEQYEELARGYLPSGIAESG